MIQYIQILRFAAAMWVALYHAKYSDFFPQLPQALRIFIDGGYAGVDIFFVISGVIMALVTQDSPRGIRHAGQFVLMRFARIYTGWWPVMAITVGMFVWLNALLPQTNVWSSAFLYFSNSSLHVSSVIWTLMYELYFYLIIGLSLLLPVGWRDRILGVMALCIAVYVAAQWSAGNYQATELHRATYTTWFFAAPLVLEFFAGYFLYRYLQKKPHHDWRWWAVATLILAMLAMYVGRKVIPAESFLAEFYFWTERTIFVGLAACALLGTALLAPPLPQGRWQWLSSLGNYSFAIYLLHSLVFDIFRRSATWLEPLYQHRVAVTCLVFVVLLAFSALYYHFIEHPLYQACRRKITQWLPLKT